MSVASIKAKNDALFSKGLNYAYRLLKFRMRAEKELSGRLQRKKFEPQVIEQVIVFLKEKGFLDDREFARAWARDKLKRPLGLARISRELIAKGVEKSIIEESLYDIKKDYDEKSAVWELAQRKIKRLKGLEPGKARSRLYSYLLRRGFSPETASDTLKQLGKYPRD